MGQGGLASVQFQLDNIPYFYTAERDRTSLRLLPLLDAAEPALEMSRGMWLMNQSHGDHQTVRTPSFLPPLFSTTLLVLPSLQAANATRRAAPFFFLMRRRRDECPPADDIFPSDALELLQAADPLVRADRLRRPLAAVLSPPGLIAADDKNLPTYRPTDRSLPRLRPPDPRPRRRFGCAAEASRGP
ncbi:hypothetical protein CDD83_7668 [Cordyceps sp. RAO-2017]|nr:hypothetical protein CDD83_7668 [Cordyceps sp. RAO-2017]